MSTFNSKTDKKLLEIAEKKGIYVSSSTYNALLSFRGVENDVKGNMARQSIISNLQIYKETNRSFVISILSILIAIIALIVAILK